MINIGDELNMNSIEVMISEEDIQKRIEELALKINERYESQELYVICILKGSVMFTTDLIKKLNMPVILDFMIVSSYGANTESSGEVKIIKDLDNSIEDKNVLIVEDIIDTGLTLNKIVGLLKKRNPKIIEICTLLDKKARRTNEMDIQYMGFEISNEFVVGYGLDIDQRYRNLPYIGQIKH